MKLKKIAQLVALIGIATPVIAQTATAERVVVTGSSIKRIQSEGALPVQIISREDLDKAGITSAEQLVSQLGANAAGADNAVSNNNVFGGDVDRLTGGSANANLRGLGPSSTLVLLNGRRVSTHGMSGGAVDLNAIPMAAVERIEILKDGASAIYGTDAIGGVMNFILRKNYTGGEASLTGNFTQQGGGAQRRASLLFGKGDLDADGFNVMASLTVDGNDILRSRDRDFANGFQPALGLSPNSSSGPYANIINAANTALPSTGSTVTLNGITSTARFTRINALSLQGKCDSIPTMVQFQPQLWNASLAANQYLCNTDYGAQSMMLAPVERVNLLSRGTFKINPNHTAFIELVASKTTAKAELTAAQFSASAAAGNLYPVNGPYYLNLQPLGVNNFDPTKPIAYRFRMDAWGPRTQENHSENTRVLAGLEGVVGKYDYKLGVSAASAKASMDLVDGYAYIDKLNAALATGKINPWLLPGQQQTAEAMALIEGSKAKRTLQGGETSLIQIDGSISGELTQLPAGPLSFAAGFDLRRESYLFNQDGGPECVSALTPPAAGSTSVYSNMVLLCPGNAAAPKRNRDIKAVYAEMIVPVSKQFEVNLQARHDDYGTIGGTTNPKVAFRYQPSQSVALRGSLNTGFRAPSVQQLAAGEITRELTAPFDDPALCPKDPAQCGLAGMDYRLGGNANLKPEKSKQGTLGIVLAPIASLTLTADYWAVDISDRIRQLTPQDVIANRALFPDNFVRKADGTMDYIRAGWINAAGSKDRGVDIGGRLDGKLGGGKWTATLEGTYLITHKERALAVLPMVELVGEFGLRTLYLRWKHTAGLTYTTGSWSTTLSQIYKSGYHDQNMSAKGTQPATANKDVDSYTLYNLYASYTGYKNTAVTVGIQNLFNTNPPFTHHDVDDVAGAGWDPRVADPRGRSISIKLNYKFM